MTKEIIRLDKTEISSDDAVYDESLHEFLPDEYAPMTSGLPEEHKPDYMPIPTTVWIPLDSPIEIRNEAKMIVISGPDLEKIGTFQCIDITQDAYRTKINLVGEEWGIRENDN